MPIDSDPALDLAYLNEHLTCSKNTRVLRVIRFLVLDGRDSPANVVANIYRVYCEPNPSQFRRSLVYLPD
jgi:hypothetical protein